jgi:hypothetical protein
VGALATDPSRATAIRSALHGLNCVVNFERANRNFRIFTAVRLASALETDFAELFSGVTNW